MATVNDDQSSNGGPHTPPDDVGSEASTADEALPSPLWIKPQCIRGGSNASYWVRVEVLDPGSEERLQYDLPLCTECAIHFGVDTAQAIDVTDKALIKESIIRRYFFRPVQALYSTLDSWVNRFLHFLNRIDHENTLKGFLRKDPAIEEWISARPNCRVSSTVTDIIHSQSSHDLQSNWMEKVWLLVTPPEPHEENEIDECNLYTASAKRIVIAHRPPVDPSSHYYLRVDVAVYPEQTLLVEVYQEPELLPLDHIRDIENAIRQMPCPNVARGVFSFSILDVFGYRKADSAISWRTPFGRLPLPAVPEQVLSIDMLIERLANHATQAPIAANSPRWNLDDYSTFLAIDPDNISARIARSKYLTLTQSYADAAVEALRVASCIQNIDIHLKTAAYLRHAWNVLQLGNRDAAIQSVFQAIQLEPENSATIFSAMEILQNDTAAAVKICQQAEELGMKSAHFDFIRGRCCWIDGDVDEAVKWFDRAITLDPDCQLALFHRGLIHLESKQFDSAEHDFTCCLNASTTQGDAWLSEVHFRRGRVRIELMNPVSALSDLTAAIQLQSDHVGSLLSRAEVYLTQGKLAMVIEDADRVIAIQSHNPAAWFIRSVANKQLGHAEDSLSDSARAIELGWNQAELFCRRAEIFVEQEDFAAALPEIERALDLDADCPQAHDLRGIIYESEGEHARGMAEDAYVRAITLAPDWPLPRLHRADLLISQGKTDEAMQEYEQAVKLLPHLGMAWLKKGQCHRIRQEIPEAIQSLTRALKEDSDLLGAYVERAVCYTVNEQFDRAAEDFRIFIDEHPRHETAINLRARMFMEADQFELAAQDFTRLIEISPSLQCLIARATAWLHLGDTEKADRDFDEAAERFPESAYQLLIDRPLIEAFVARSQEDYPKAIEKVNSALEVDPDHVSGLMVRAGCQWYTENWVEAIDDFTRVLEIEPDCVEALSGRGQVQNELNEFVEAVADLDRAIELAAEDPDENRSALAYAHNGRALAHAGLSQFDEAMHDYERSIELCPGNAWVQYNLGRTYDLRGDVKSALCCFKLAQVLADPRLSVRQRARLQAYLDRYDTTVDLSAGTESDSFNDGD